MVMKTKGGIDVEKICVGDVHYEYFLGQSLRVTVTEKPKKIISGDYTQFEWKAKSDDGRAITYLITKGLAHYGPELYDFDPCIGKSINSQVNKK